MNPTIPKEAKAYVARFERRISSKTPKEQAYQRAVPYEQFVTNDESISELAWSTEGAK